MHVILIVFLNSNLLRSSDAGIFPLCSYMESVNDCKSWAKSDWKENVLLSRSLQVESVYHIYPHFRVMFKTQFSLFLSKHLYIL